MAPPPNPSPAQRAFDAENQLRQQAVHTNIDVANALRIARPTLGQDAGIALYRLLRLVALEDIIGRGAAGTAYLGTRPATSRATRASRPSALMAVTLDAFT